ncbi:carbon-nitrogen hydrolase family protein [Aestuariirhabdus litorea]|uniref:Carbon-nitrogen hydrolase family protein n=1 Tax=Aestuariirhabdus litorea TaxID=2528527 RepID=A0A3P3VLS2_9GAMM|nr:carbon-nitrogen hydrolase family protein [Aestuariirhabdus litorea]RRJ83712.1 carbon-nitrogen hydrolase family protein [Aestuariirhabdus litorea]RWW96934.1 carbon-nitrogen hydrolase family protein [Endozoicomonadaceae bacterium GTF-13]
MKACRVALLQMSSGVDLETNMGTVEQALKEAAAQGAELVVLPECVASFGGGKVSRAVEQVRQGAVRQRLGALCATHALWLVAGTLPVVDAASGDPRAFSRCFVFDSRGQEVSYYDKIHLFDVDVADTTGRYRESSDYQPGRHLTLIDTPWGRLAPLVCYDLRFPELFRALALQGAEIFSLPSAFTAVTGQAHWEPLIRARAIENGAYLLAANQCGQQGARATWGHSMVVDPWGKLCGSAGSTPQLLVVDLEPAILQQARQSIPSLQHHQLPPGWYPLPTRLWTPNGSIND